MVTVQTESSGQLRGDLHGKSQRIPAVLKILARLNEPVCFVAVADQLRKGPVRESGVVTGRQLPIQARNDRLTNGDAIVVEFAPIDGIRRIAEVVEACCMAQVFCRNRQENWDTAIGQRDVAAWYSQEHRR